MARSPVWTVLVLTTLAVVTQSAMRKYNCTKYQYPEHSTSDDVTDTSRRPATTSPEYECTSDWNKVCTEDAECCSKVCLKPFCKILGLDQGPSPAPSRHRGTTAATPPTDNSQSSSTDVPYCIPRPRKPRKKYYVS